MKTTLSICVPGQRLCRADDSHAAGSGTYVRNGFIYASLAGYICESAGESGSTVTEVRHDAERSAMPYVGAIVTATVTHVNPRFCKCLMLCVGESALREAFRGQVRREDVRATEKDRIEMYRCFRPGDVILARVLSLGDQYSYLLTTAENELGVVIARAENGGAPMIPISWTEMQCPSTFAKESRKVARVAPPSAVTIAAPADVTTPS
ncbi:PREDICTED: exosome complex component CSL4-like [Priapulus caudatus]|uniref:Exosome complex component CSL4-like n=1 Tax=Priapulus caudatus TaxID=37621 RepID=A0ABM1E960_PRICU|nr:PREDICTED: exosome complex component CSL4-like [Priapulus caudatus]